MIIQSERTDPHVVIVDDDPLIRRVSSTILTKAGMRVTELSSGKELLSYWRHGNEADLILLDIMMPDMDGFETFTAFRELEDELGSTEEVPVILLTGDDDKTAEVKGFALGALDFIRKPFEAYVLLHRIDNVLSKQKQIEKLSEEMQTDPLTGILNKASVTRKLTEVCEEETGILLVIDLDSFKPVNDIYGHDAGDKVLIAFSDILRSSFRSRDIMGRIGGDEFVVFLRGTTRETLVADSTRQLNERIPEEARKILGEEMSIPLGASVGAAIGLGDVSFDTLFRRADHELLHVKQAGKHGYRVWSETAGTEAPSQHEENNLQKLKMILDERNVGNEVLWLGQEDFGNIYRYMLRFFRRYHEKAYRLLFSVTALDEDMPNEEFLSIMESFGDVLKKTLRNSDIMMQCDSSHYLLLLPMVSDYNIDKVLHRIDCIWEKQKDSSRVEITCEKDAVVTDSAGS